MKLTLLKSTLASALGSVSSVCGRALPVLSFARLQTGDGGAVITTTDLDCRYERNIKLDADKWELGECLIPVRKVKDWLGIVMADEVTLESSESHIKLSSPESGSIRFSTLKVEEFPPETSSDKVFIAEADFVPIKNIALCMIDSGAGRPELEAIFIEPEGDGIICASSDGRKIGTVIFKAKLDDAKPWTPLALPSKYVNLVAGLGTCQFHESKNDLHFSTESSSISIRKSEYPIPNWRRVFDQTLCPIVGSITVIREEFCQAIEECHCLQVADGGVRVTLAKSESGMSISCGEDYHHEISGRIKGEFPTVILSTDHLMGFVGLLDESPLKLEFTGSRTLVHANAADLGVRWFICPMFAKEEKTA